MLRQLRPICWNENMPVHAPPLDCSRDYSRYPNCPAWPRGRCPPSVPRAITSDIRTVRHGHEAAARPMCELRQPAVNLLGAVRRHGQRLHRGGSGGPNPTTAARSASKSRPKWLRLSEGEVGTLRILEHGCDARLLTARKTTRSECLLGAALALIAAGVLRIDDLFAQSLMHRDVIQVAEGVLQFLQSSHKTLPSPRSLLARERAAKELRSMPEFFSLNAHLMSPLGVKLAELRTRFQNLLPASPQLVGGSIHNRLFSQQAGEIVGAARPVAGFDPARSVENKTTKACGVDGRAGAGKRFPTSSLEVVGENRHSRSIRLAIRDRPHNALDENIKFARWAQFLSDPLELGLHLLRLPIKKNVGKQRDRRPQTPKSDPRLVQS